MNNIKTKLYWLLKGSYNPINFWEKWGKTFINEPQQQLIYEQHQWILQILLQEKPLSLLEVGCGFGRNIKYITKNYIAPLSITGIDFSNTMLAQAKKYLASIPIKKRRLINLKNADILNLPFPTSSFDVILCHGVLMHIKPQNINQAVKELLRVTKKSLILVEQNDTIKPQSDKPYQKINYFTYAYPYKKLFAFHDAKIKEHHRKEQFDWLLIYDLRKTK
jgi:ubiquinone/menaquinone biosynthesis C-methylase UbiE